MKWVKAKDTEGSYNLVDDDGRVYIILDQLEDGSWEWSPYGIDIGIYGRFDGSWSVEEAILHIKENLDTILMETVDFYTALSGNIPEEIEA